MDDEVLVRVLHRVADRAEQLEPLARRQLPASSQYSVDRLAVDVLHHEVGLPVVGRAAVEEPRDVRVLEPGQDLPLARKRAPHDART